MTSRSARPALPRGRAGQVLYVSVMVPWRIAFQPPSCGGLASGDSSAESAAGDCLPSGFQAFDTAVDVLFWLDLVFNFRTGARTRACACGPAPSPRARACLAERRSAARRPGVVDAKKNVHMAPSMAARNYLRGWFAVDFLSVFPFQSAAGAVLHGSSSSVAECARAACARSLPF